MRSSFILWWLIFTSSVAVAQSRFSTTYTHDTSKVEYLNWSLPISIEPSNIFQESSFPNELFYDYSFYPSDTISYFRKLSSQFTPRIEAPLEFIEVFVEEVHASRDDSVVFYHTEDRSEQWKLNERINDETLLEFGIKITAPYTGFLEKLIFDAETVSSPDGFNDQLEFDFYGSNFGLESNQSHFNEGIVWFFGLPRTTNNVTTYGVRFDAPSGVDSTKINGIDVYVFTINDTRFYSGFDTPANDSVAVTLYLAGGDGLPHSTLARKVIPFNELSAGLDNRIDFSTDNVYVPGDSSFVVGYEVITVGNQDYLGLISGTSFDPPKNRTVMFENGRWVTLSESDSWGDGGAKGAEIRTVAYFEDPNNRTPDEAQPVAETVSYSFDELKPNQSDTLTLTTPIRLFQGEEVWVAVSQRTVIFRDSAAFFASKYEPGVASNRSAVKIRSNEGTSWKYAQNTAVNSSINFRMQAGFRGEANDRMVVSLYSDNNGQPGEELGSTSRTLSELQEHSFNSFYVADWDLLLTQQPVHLVIGTEMIQDPDGVVLRSTPLEASPFPSTSNGYSEDDQSWMPFAPSPLTVVQSLDFWGAVLQNGVDTSVEEHESIKKFELQPNFPNPFNPSTNIRFSVPQASEVSITVFDITGRKVLSKMLGQLSAGTHTVEVFAGNLSSGMYIYQVQAGSQVLVDKFTLMK